MTTSAHGFQIINPADGECVRIHERIEAAEAAARIEAAHEAWLDWRHTSWSTRRAVIMTLADLLDAQQDKLAARCTMEMGKPISESRAEIEKCAWVCRYYAEHAEAMLSGHLIPLDKSTAHLMHAPIGVLYAVMPWNFPFWQVFRAAAPQLMAGNAMVLTHAPNTMGCGADITDLFRHTDAPSGLFSDLPIDIADSPKVIRHPHVRGVTLTGSERAGRAVAAEAGAQLKKCVMELGGSDPYIVLEDADLELAVDRCVRSRMLNCGQVCIAAKRLIVVDEMYDQFRDAVRDRMAAIKMQDPMQPDAQLGPMARQDLRHSLHAHIQHSLDAGASLSLGGVCPDRPGWWYPPTMLEDVQPGMPAFDEEIFGPVACLVRATDQAQAIALAGKTRFGLAAAVFTQDLDRGHRLADDALDVGSVALNDLVKSDPRVPFGGTRSSGFGRELGLSGIHEFVNLKSVVIPTST